MIGIDVVDLSDPLFRKRTQRSLGFILSKQDRLVAHPQLFWLLWSSKEAIFKCQRLEDTFSPTQIPVHLKIKGEDILFTSGEIKGQIFIKDQFILAIAQSTGGEVNYKVYEEETSNWSATIREKVTHHFERNGASVSMDRDPIGLPVLSPGKIPVSFTHHGKFGAFAYPKSA